jgi:shikimate kinase
MTSAASRPHLKLLCLAGFMGSGKTTIGRLLAQQLGWRFTDLDERIQERAGLRISEIFEKLGEPAFRTLEHEQLVRALAEAASSDSGTVMALGGGTFAQPANLVALRQACKPAEGPREGCVIWLDCGIEELLARCVTMEDRPLFQDEAAFRTLYQQRLPFYRLADLRVPSSGTPRQVVERILALGVVEAGLAPAAQPPSAPEAHT